MNHKTAWAKVLRFRALHPRANTTDTAKHYAHNDSVITADPAPKNPEMHGNTTQGRPGTLADWIVARLPGGLSVAQQADAAKRIRDALGEEEYAATDEETLEAGEMGP